MSKVLVIGAGGVGSVAVHKMAMNPDIFPAVLSCGVACPWARHHQCCTSGEPVTQGLVYSNVGGAS